MWHSCSSTRLIGRREELAALLEAAGRARDGAPAVSLVLGDAGVGKSRLLAEYAGATRIGRVVAAGCLALGVEGLPFAPFVAVLRQLVRDLAVHQPDALQGLRELRRLLPELGAVEEGTTEGRARLFEEVLSVLESAAHPDGLAVIVEDVHWADDSTRDLLVFLMHNLGAARVHLLVSCRTDELHRKHPMRRLLPELSRLPDVGQHFLAPLSRDEVAEQAAALHGRALSPDVVDRVYARSGGNPLFVESLIEQSECDDAPLPDGPREMLLGPVERLDPTARAVANAAAVAGSPVAHELLAAVCGLEESELEAALGVLIDANLLRVDGGTYVFRHALLAEAVYDALLPGQRVRLHRASADALEEGAGGLAATRLPARLAYHRYASHDLPRALKASWLAARVAADARAYPERMRMLERVLELWDEVPDAAERTGTDHVGVLKAAAATATAVGDPARGAGLASAALAELTGETSAEALTPDTIPADQVVRVANLLHVRGRAFAEDGMDRGVADLRAALRVLPADDPDRAMLSATLAEDLLTRRAFDEALDVGEEALHLARQVGDIATEARILAGLGRYHGIDGGDCDRGLRMLERSRELAARNNWPVTELQAIHATTVVLRINGRVNEALDAAWEGVRRARELDLEGAPIIDVVSALRDLGRLREAEDHAARFSRAGRSARWRATLAALRAVIASERDDVAAAADHLAYSSRMLPEDTTLFVYVAQRSTIRLILQWAEGRWREAREDALLLLEATGAATKHDQVRLWDIMEIAATLAWQAVREPGVEDLEEWDAFRGRLRAIMRGLEAPGPTVQAMAVGARAALAADLAESRALFDESAERWRALHRPVGEGQSLVLAAEAAAELGDRDGALRRLRAAEELTQPLGASRVVRWAERVAARFDLELRAPAAPSPPGHGLTPREAEVLRLLAEGATNREIASRLHITAKTASVHVSNLMSKLDVGNRSAAAAKARELELA